MTDLYDIVNNYNLRRSIVDYDMSVGSDGILPDERILSDNVPFHSANGISSLITEGRFKDWHMPVLDIDMDCCVVPSTTPGHHHLIIANPMRQLAYLRLLNSLAHYGIIEPGFAGAAEKRGSSWIRTPWTSKNTAKGTPK